MLYDKSNVIKVLVMALLLGALVLPGCSLLGSKPAVVITAPPSGSTYIEGDDVAVQSTSADQFGISRVELTIDGAVIRSDTPPTQQTNFTIIQTWKATPGVHTIIVRAYNTAGMASDPVAVSVSVGAGVAGAPTAPSPGQPPEGQPTSSAPPGPGGCTDDATFVADVTVPDGTVVAAGQAFNKIWRLSNSGSCAWGPGYQFVHAGGESMTGNTVVAVPATAVGATVDILVPMNAPTAPGLHTGQWKMRNASGVLFGPTVLVSINVPGAPSGDTPSGPGSSPSGGCSGTPNIASFSASPNPITAGSSTTLSWGAVTNADSAEIDQGIGGIETPGSKSVSPATTTTYTLTAHCGSNTQTAQVTVTVNPPPPAVPAVPTGFSANGTGTTVAFTWTDASTNELGFRIYKVGDVAPVVTIGAHTGTGGMAYNWTGRPCNLSATYYVRAYNAAGESGSSNSNSAVTIPCAPTGFSATGVTQSSVNVSFTDNATNETGFHVYRTGTSATLETLSARSGTGAKTGTVNPVICGQTYTYYARAYNSAGESSASNSNSGTTSACTVSVNFTSVRVYDDEDPVGSGELWFSFNVNGTTRRWPSSGTISANSGDTKPISGTSVSLNLMRTQNLSITVKGEDDDTWPDPDDSLGTANATYTGSSTWSEGTRCVESAAPHDFRICFTINVTP